MTLGEEKSVKTWGRQITEQLKDDEHYMDTDYKRGER